MRVAALIRGGFLCNSCSPGKCVDCPDDRSPAFIACPNCNERGCQKCNETGRFELKSCPNRFIGNEMHDVIQMADDYKAGLSPIAGGVLDQSASFVAAARFLASEDNRVSVERNK